MAKVGIERKNILTVSFHQEKTDEDYGTCMWADFHFNLDEYELMIMSDCGNYSYGWPKTPKAESFIHLMRRIGSDYLLGKISDRTQFHLEESKRDTIDNLEEWHFSSPPEMAEAIEEINDIDCGTAESFHRDTIEILDRYGVDDAWELARASEDYPAGAKKIVAVFAEYIQPALAEQPQPPKPEQDEAGGESEFERAMKEGQSE